jgi:hypothetical protein
VIVVPVLEGNQTQRTPTYKLPRSTSFGACAIMVNTGVLQLDDKTFSYAGLRSSALA